MLTHKTIMKLLSKERKTHEAYRKQAIEAADAARDEGDKPNSYNIHWSNCLIIRGAVFKTMPRADVRRRYQASNDQDEQQQAEAKEDKELARLIERGITYQADVNDYESPARAVVKNMVEEGIGIPRVVYNVETQPVPDPVNPEAELMAAIAGEEIEPTFEQGLEEIVSQDVGVEHWPSQYFHWEPGRTSWESVNWIAYESWRPAKEVSKEYKVEIKSGSDTDSHEEREAKNYTDEVQLFEFMHKPTRKVYIVSPVHPAILETYDDKLSLKGFYHSPRPSFSNLKSTELIPKPDYQFIESQIVELNRITDRIKAISKYIKARGYYDAKLKGLSGLMNKPDGTLLPVENLVEALEGSNFDKAIAYLPLGELITTLRELQAQRREVKEEIFEILGISDIVRGTSQASESATAQQLKGQWVGVRLQDKIDDVARLWRDVYRMIAEIMCEHFDPMQLQLMTGINVTERMLQSMRSDISRSFAVDIETDSTIQSDDQIERQQTLEMVNVLLGHMQTVIPAVTAGHLPIPFVQETLLMITSKYKNGKALEDAIQELGPHLKSMQQFQQQMQGMQQQLQQAGQAVQQKDGQLQQAGKQIQDLQKALQQFNQKDEMRKDAESGAKIRKDNEDAKAQQIENAWFAREKGIELEGGIADVEQTRKETALMGLV